MIIINKQYRLINKNIFINISLCIHYINVCYISYIIIIILFNYNNFI